MTYRMNIFLDIVENINRWTRISMQMGFWWRIAQNIGILVAITVAGN